MVTVRCLLGLLILYIGATLSLNTITFFSENNLTAIDDVSVLTSPGYPNNFESMNCTWIIEASNESAVVYVEVLRSSIGDNSNSCGYDSVSAYDGPSTNSPLLKKWCGTQTPNMTTTGRYLTLHFLSSGSVEGFNLTFQQKTNDSDKCGEELTAESYSKELTSPGYPNIYSNNLDCKWIITAYYSSYNIKLVAVNTDIETSYSCAVDSVKVYDGSSTFSRLLGKFCGTQTPSFVSTSTSMTVTFTTDASSGRGGFRLSYQSGHFSAAQCSPSSLTAYSYPQYLTSPGYPQDYSNYLDCKWSITATSTSHKINLIVTDANIESSSSCRYDSVKVYNGPSINSSVLGTFCGSQKPTYVSSGNHVTVTFKTDGSDEFRGFKMSYQSGHFSVPQTCGTTRLSAYSSIKYFTSPGYPSNYGTNLNCKWIISTYSYNIKLVAVSSDIESSFNCTHDSVKVYDGSSTYSRRLGNFCGSQTPSFVSTSSYMTVTFTTDASSEREGFRLSYQSGHFNVPQTCGTTRLSAYSSIKHFTSPGYPSNYGSNLNCKWIISTYNNYNIKLVAISSDIASSINCASDSVKVYDGDSTTSSRLLGTFCGTQTPSFISTSSSMTVTFTTDASTSRRGFRLSYQSGHFSATQCSPSSLTAYSYSQYLTSPGYPQVYSNNLDCQWSIRATSSSYNIKLIVTDANIESSSNCSYDSVKVYNGPGIYSSVLGTFCGTLKPTYVSSGSHVTVVFKTDRSTVAGGFKMLYRSGHFGDTHCGSSSLTADSYSQYLSSPGYPREYSNNLDCKWSISAVSSSFNIKLIVTAADIDSTSDCSYDVVKIYDGPNLYSRVLGSFCGSQKPTYVSSGSHVTVTFKTNGVIVAGGFKMSYRSGRFNDTQCSFSSLTAYSSPQYLKSPGYPLDYTNNLDCKWSITATSSNYNIKLIVIDADIESSSDCSYDSVKIYDGYNTYSSVLGTFCGSQKPTYVSSGSQVTVTFKTDGTNVATGFKMSYQSGRFSEWYSCTKKELTSFEWSNEIRSPLYPADYPNNADCTWTIDSGNSNKVVYIEITSLDIDSTYGCDSDYLQAFDDRYGYGSSMGKWCGTEIPSAQHSTGQYMYIKFQSDSSLQGTGFKLQYSTTSASKFSKSGVIIGGIAGGSVLIIGVACFIFRRARMAGRRTQTPGESNPRRSTRPGSQQPMIYIIRGNRRQRDSPPATFVPPPSYDEVMGNDQPHQGEAPPPYSSLGTTTIEVSSSVTENPGVDASPNEEADDAIDVAGAEVDVPDTVPILTSDNTPRTCQGLDNAAAESEA